MDGHFLLHFANLSTFLVCTVLKLPQMLVLMRAKASKGVSVPSLLLELIGKSISFGATSKQFVGMGWHLTVILKPWFIVFVSYQMYYEYPLPTYMEYPILIIQDIILLLLILYYNGNMLQSLLYAALFLVGWKLLTVEKWVLDMAMSVCTFISAGSKLLQLQCLWRSKDSVQVSVLTWALAAYTCMARIFTTMVTTGDTQVFIRYVAMTVLNVWVTATVIYYKPTSKKRD